MKILSCGAGMQSTALALMSCEQSMTGHMLYSDVPIYDAIIFCDLGLEPPWVYRQVEFIQVACQRAGIPFYILDTNLYDVLKDQFGKKHISSIPFWSISADGKKAKMRRHCTIDFKILAVQRFVRLELLGYRKGQRTRKEDIGAHEMHIGFSYEERKRMNDSHNPMYVNCFPLVEMQLERKNNYQYVLETWGLDVRASACCFCPFHRNYFFQFVKEHFPDYYAKLLELDEILEQKQPLTPIKSKLYISRSRKRICELTADECHDAEYFPYQKQMVWNGF